MLRMEDRNDWFAQELQRTTSDDNVRYDSVEATLVRRIRESEQLGILGILCLEELPEAVKMDRIERDLFTQITQYSEYDEPVNECLNETIDLPEKQWDRIASKIEDKLMPVTRLPLWEQQLHAPQTEPTVGHWEAFEQHLFDRIRRLEQQHGEQWEQLEIQDEPVSTSSLERAEVLLENHIRAIASRPLWEHVIAADKIVPLHWWDTIERCLFSSIDEKESMPLRKQPFWFIVEHYSALLKGVAIAGAAVLAFVSTYIGIQTYEAYKSDIASVVYQTEGNATSQYKMVEPVGEHCSTDQGGSVTLVNDHGYVALHNRSEVTISKMSKREARYKVDFSRNKGNSGGNVAFFVKKKRRRRQFLVETPDYRIEVMGTYFKVESSPDGSVTTRVLEGLVNVKGSPLGDLSLSAGQSLAFDSVLQQYRVFNGGRTVSREEVENVPDVAQVRECPVTTFTSAVPRTYVYINGAFRGITPLKVRLPQATYRIMLRKQGYATIDTILSITDLQQAFSFTSTPEKKIATARVQKNEDAAPAADAGSSDDRSFAFGVSSGSWKSRSSAVSRWYVEAQQAERNGLWRKAIWLYQKVFDASGTSSLRREDVLFSIGKIQAEHIADVEVAKKSFLTYIALFPQGSFAGESWLRLAELEFQKSQESAIHYYLKFFHQFPRHPRSAELKDRVGVIYLQQKQYDKAIMMFDQALSAGRTSSQEQTRSIATHLHRALLEKGERQRAALVHSRYMLSKR